MKKTYQGSCHCGAVRFEVDADLSAGTMKCNCDLCTKTRMWGAVVMPDAFRLISGENDFTEYRYEPASDSPPHLFCKHCGVRTHGEGDSPAMGGKFYVVRVNCLEGVDVEVGQDRVGDGWMSNSGENLARPPNSARIPESGLRNFGLSSTIG